MHRPRSGWIPDGSCILSFVRRRIAEQPHVCDEVSKRRDGNVGYVEHGPGILGPAVGNRNLDCCLTLLPQTSRYQIDHRSDFCGHSN